MPTYKPLKIGIAIKASASDLVNFHWETNGIFADFILPDSDTQMLRVTFDRQCIVRLLDEMPLSTENDPALRQGTVPECFAYQIEGAPFAQQQSPTWLEVSAPVRHYQFVTGWACMDVLCSAAPTFSLVGRNSDAA